MIFYRLFMKDSKLYSLDKKKINRFERKWILNGGDHLKLVNALLRSNFFFKFQFPNRKVNSLYFDTNEYSSIIENLDGVTKKKKIRLRWYGDKMFLNKPMLEIKKKRGYETKKESYNLEILNGINYLDPQNLKKILKTINLFLNLKKNLYPILTTHYERSYFISNQDNVRATIDFNLESIFLKNLSEMNILKKYYPECILELKYSTNIDRFVRHQLNDMSLRLSKNSKFVKAFFKRPNFFG